MKLNDLKKILNKFNKNDTLKLGICNPYRTRDGLCFSVMENVQIIKIIESIYPINYNLDIFVFYGELSKFSDLTSELMFNKNNITENKNDTL